MRNPAMVLISLMTLPSWTLSENVNFAFSQNDYDVIMEIVDCTWHNKTVVKDPKFGLVFYNRTQKVANCSAELLVDLSNEIVISVQVYKFVSNEYRFFPVSFQANACEAYKRNSFGVQVTIDKTSNIHPCNAKKGFYYAYNVVPEFSKFPPHLPRGAYKAVINFVYGTIKFLKSDLYMRIIDKPLALKNR